jgi:hypothetical protein
MFAMTISLVAMPTAIAQEEGPDVPAYPYINAIPNPVGVGQQVTLHVGTVWPVGTSVDWGWEGLSVTIEGPDGTETITGIRTDSTGGTGISWTPQTAGTYMMQTHFPNQQAPEQTGFFQSGPPSFANMLAGDSPVLEVVVQEEPVPVYPGHSLPTEYWTRPIDAQIWEWAPIAGHWLGDQVSMDASPPAQTLYKDYNDDAPETAHVLWTKPITMGGLAGGQAWNQGFEQSDAYEPKWTGSVIIGGVLYYNEFETTGSETGLERNVIAVDLHTGEELWKKPLIDLEGNNRNLDFGQVFYWDSYNYHGVFPYLWTEGGGAWNAYDAYTGRWEYTMTDVPSGTRVYGSKGEIYVISVDTTNGVMSQWNSSRQVSLRGSWRPHGQVINASTGGFDWEVPIPTDLVGSVDKIREGIVLGTNCDKYTRTTDSISMWALSLEPGNEGDLLYNKEWAVPYLGHYDVQDADTESDVFTISGAETCQHWGFRLSTGSLLWGPSEMQHYTDNWGYSSSNSWDNIAYGKYISGNYGGIVYCRDAETGDLLWTYVLEDEFNENVQQTKWRFRPAFFADGKVYLENTEHNPYDPMHRGCPFVCLDMETGERVFDIPYRGSEWSSTPIIGDSIIAMFNVYDLRIYAMGKGPSATSISIPMNVIAEGDSVMVSGMVTDISPGTEEYALRARFPDGVPVVADDNMSDWMLYVHNQFGRPEEVLGVEVTISVYDPNGNFYDVATATTDDSGFYKAMFTPPVPGEYTVFAWFAGTKAFYPSYTQTALGVTEAPAATPGPTEPPASPADMYILPGISGIIVAVVVIGLIIILMLRKR